MLKSQNKAHVSHLSRPNWMVLESLALNKKSGGPPKLNSITIPSSNNAVGIL